VHVTALQNCPNCSNALDLDGPLYSSPDDPLLDVYLCNGCGLIYRPALHTRRVPRQQPYGVGAWTEFAAAHRERLNALIDDVGSDLSLNAGDAVLDIGPGMGWLVDRVRAIAPRVRYVAVEPVTELALQIKRDYPAAIVLNGSFDETALPASAFKAIFVCGVDYLFHDLRGAFEKLASLLAPGGTVVIQRNVFVDQEGYIGQPIRDLETLFSPNPAIRNWFHSSQYAEFVGQFLRIRRSSRLTQSFTALDGHGFTSCSMTFVCEAREPAAAGAVPITSYRDRVVEQLERLRWRVAA